MDSDKSNAITDSDSDNDIGDNHLFSRVQRNTNRQTTKDRKPRQGDGKEPVDLFPKIKSKDRIKSNSTSFNEKNSNTDEYSEIDLSHSSLNSYRSNTHFDTSPPISTEIVSSSNDSMSDDLRSSVMHQIINNKQVLDEYDLGLPSNRFYFTKLYDKYTSKDKQFTQERGDDEQNLTDFERYNRNIVKEDKIKNSIKKMMAKKQQAKSKSSYADNNILTILNEEDLHSGFIRPNISNHSRVAAVAGANGARRGTAGGTGHKKGWFHFLNRNNSEVYNTATMNHSDEKLQAQVENNYVTSSQSFDGTLGTVPIDDYIDVDELPIEMQNLRTDKSDMYHRHGHKVSSGTDVVSSVDNAIQINMILSNDEHVDYNFERIRKTDPERDQNHKNISSSGRSGNGSDYPFWINKIGSFFKFNINRKYTIQRKLKVRHMNQIALGGTLGVGLLLSSGKAFSIAGPLGCLLGFIFSGLIVLATMLSFCEMVTLIPLCGGISGVSSRFVDDAFGFALGVGYWFSYGIGYPTEITAASIMLSFYSGLDIPGPSTAGWISLFLVITLLINLCDIRVYGEFEYFSTLIKMLILVALMIYMVVLNCGGSAPYYEKIGFRYWQHSKSDFANSIIYGPFRPTFDVKDTGTGSLNGIGGAKGRFFQFLVASIVAAYAYVGTEIVIIAGGESRNPRRAIPSATRNIYWRIFIFYILAIFIIGLNIYSGDPRLLRYFSSESSLSLAEKTELQAQEAHIISLNGGANCDGSLFKWAGFSNGNQSPFVIAIQTAGLCSFGSVVNGFLVYFALTAASSQLYAATRTLYYLAIQGKAPKMFSICSKNGVPYVSVLFTGAFGGLAFLSVNNNTALVFERLLSVCATTGLLVWSGMCLSFIRFYYGLKLRPDIISRDDYNYPYRSPFQPYLAYFGMITSFCLVIVVGFVVFLKGNWSAPYFISNYGSLFLFVFCYLGYKVFRHTKIHRLDQVDLDSGRREIDRIIWEDERNYASNCKEIFRKALSLLF